MTSLADRVQEDLVRALKQHDAMRASTLRLVKSAAKYAEVEKRAPLTDDEFESVLARQAKMRREAAAEFERAGRPERAEQERSEMAILQEYLPEQMDDDAITAVLKQVIADTGASSIADINRVMPLAMASLRGRADGSRVSSLARQMLAARSE